MPVQYRRRLFEASGGPTGHSHSLWLRRGRSPRSEPQARSGRPSAPDRGRGRPAARGVPPDRIHRPGLVESAMGRRTLILSEHGIDIGPATARRVRETGSLVRRPGEPRVAVAGKDVVSGVPRQTPLAAEQVREVLRTSYSRICDLLVQILEPDPLISCARAKPAGLPREGALRPCGGPVGPAAVAFGAAVRAPGSPLRRGFSGLVRSPSPELSELLAERFAPALVLDRDLPLTRFGALWSELITPGVDHLSQVPAPMRTTTRLREPARRSPQGTDPTGRRHRRRAVPAMARRRKRPPRRQPPRHLPAVTGDDEGGQGQASCIVIA